ncbi:glycosyltransferase [Photobacterium damselae subsp. damselae]|uniref:glycosyltransferase family 4 protein n=1 Tax=Photobacterium damselae TaxID=38293 RepID=UPI0015F562A1|nr:glycosyltransferase family 4 protein [Photobacterium damselae]MBA5685264.1 glycosyltransferase [Photobacterium damselae subsp. damselae]
MKKILILTPRFPFPVIGGDRLRIYEVCKELSKNYELTLLSLCENRKELSYEVDDHVFKSIYRVLLPKYRSYLNCLLSLPFDKPLQVAYYDSSEFQSLVNKLAPEHDLILPHLIRMANYAVGFSIPKVLEMTDAISMNYDRVLKTDNNAGLKGIIYKLEAKRLNQYEKSIASKFDCNVLVSPFDRDFLFDINSKEYSKTLVCSNGVDLDKLPYSYSHNNKILIFIGNMFSAQNFDAAFWFAKNVLPELQKNGDYIFKVIGRIKEDDAKKLRAITGVEVSGAVDSVVTEAKGALAGICSVRLAAGVQNKILEYMALGIPSITTSTGLEGLEAIPDKDILVADTVDDYIKYILKLNEDPVYSENLAKNGFAYVQDNHSWQGKLKPLVDRIEKII